MANIFIDGITKICSAWLNKVDWAVTDALGDPQSPEDVRDHIGAMPTAPATGLGYLGTGAGWALFPPEDGIAGQVLMKQSDIYYDIVWGTPTYLPEGGVADDVLTKMSGSYGDVAWRPVEKELPLGGDPGYVLVKVTADDYDVAWEAIPAIEATVGSTDEPPATPVPGQLWFESDTGRTFIWYDDGTSAQWVLQSDPGVLAQGGSGNLSEAPVDGASYVRRDGGWYLQTVQQDPADALQYARVNGAWARTDHGSMLGLGDDDHAQYLNNARGDARYAPVSHGHVEYLPLAGGAMVGALILAQAPQADLEAATKLYVDTMVPTVSGGFPAGTVMLFQQSTAPTGWTKLTEHDNKALRVVSGSVGSGGSVSFSALFGRTSTDSHVLTTTQVPSHTHSFSATTGSGGAHTHSVYTWVYKGTGGVDDVPAGTEAKFEAKETDEQPAHTHTVSGTTGSSGSGGSHSHNLDMRLSYVDVIMARKD